MNMLQFITHFHSVFLIVYRFTVPPAVSKQAQFPMTSADSVLKEEDAVGLGEGVLTNHCLMDSKENTELSFDFLKYCIKLLFISFTLFQAGHHHKFWIPSECLTCLTLGSALLCMKWRMRDLFIDLLWGYDIIEDREINFLK